MFIWPCFAAALQRREELEARLSAEGQLARKRVKARSDRLQAAGSWLGAQLSGRRWRSCSET